MGDLVKSAGSQNDIITKFHELIKDANVSTLREIIKVTSNVINNPHSSEIPAPSKDELDTFFKYIPNIFNPESLDISATPTLETQPSAGDLLGEEQDVFLDNLRTEIESLGLDQRSSDPRKVTTQWITTDQIKHKDLNSALCMSRFKNISKLCKIINAHDECVGEMNGCIVNCYRSSSARTNPHADDECYINQKASICTFSLGSSRDIAIFEHKKHNPATLRSFSLNENSVFVMHPGSQSVTKHKVMPSSEENADIRYSISFRNIISEEVDTARANQIQHQNENSNKVNTTVIFGSSMSKELCVKRLAGKRRNIKVINLSVSGAKIPDVSKDMDDFFTGTHSHFKNTEDNLENLQIRNVFISIGTNDIRRLRNGTNHLYIPVENLLKKARTLFTGANIYFQAVLPMPLEEQYTVKNVLSFNNMVLRACAAQKCMYLDVFDKFLDPFCFPNKFLYRRNSSSNRADLHLNRLGLSVLARSYIDYIRGRFNPIRY